MEITKIPPSDILKPYVKYYWTFTADQDVLKDVLYPSGYVELAINVSNGRVISHIGNRSINMPNLEVLGQLTLPSKVSATKGTTLLVARLHPHANALFFPNQVSSLTNDSIDLCDILGPQSIEFYNCLMDQNSLEKQIKVLDDYLIQLVRRNERDFKKLKLIERISNHVYQDVESFNIESLASHYGFSGRYIQKLFLNYVGLTPKRFFTVQRFNKSLELMRSTDATLTSIAQECGYYDQAHFIKEFKSYTGMTPSQVQLRSPAPSKIEFM